MNGTVREFTRGIAESSYSPSPDEVVNVAYSRAGDDALDLDVRDPTFSGDVLSERPLLLVAWGKVGHSTFGRKYLKRESCASALVK